MVLKAAVPEIQRMFKRHGSPTIEAGNMRLTKPATCHCVCEKPLPKRNPDGWRYGMADHIVVARA